MLDIHHEFLLSYDVGGFPMSDHFNELLLQTLKEVGVRLERLEGRVDHVINEKADKIGVSNVKTELKADVSDVKTELNDVKAELKSVNKKLDLKAGKTDVNDVKADVNGLQDDLRSNGLCLDRIETRIRTLQWTMTAGFAALGIILAFMKETF